MFKYHWEISELDQTNTNCAWSCRRSIAPVPVLLFELTISPNLLYESLALGRLLEGTWALKNVPKVTGMKCLENPREIQIPMTIDMFHAHSAELSLSQAPATEKPETCRLAQTNL